MVTDDPGTPGNGHWEINIAGLLAADRNQTLLRLPYFDINYGLGDRLQLKVETGFAILQQIPAPVQSGAAVVLAGVKYRFFDEDIAGVAVSTYPQFQFHSSLSSKQPGLTEPGEQFFLPLEFSKAFGNWDVNPEVGYLFPLRKLTNCLTAWYWIFKNPNHGSLSSKSTQTPIWMAPAPSHL